ncbi:MAG: hypothetical protein KGJ59_02325 [Bacteroidota bacterium]|nr:hypothetical protein [Bacteroidota bacterium]
MRYFLQHKRVFGSVLLAFIFLTSSGFTVIVHQCTMAAVPLCCAEKQDNAGECSSTAPTCTIYGVVISCYVNTVVSSLNTTPATVEKSSLSKSFSAKSGSFALLSSGGFTANSPAVLNTAFVFQHTSPPSVEKRILLSSFLI